MDEICPYGVYVEKCKTYPECVCGRHIARAAENHKQLEEKLTQQSGAVQSDVILCSDCPPIGYPTDKTRCDLCPRHTADGGSEHG